MNQRSRHHALARPRTAEAAAAPTVLDIEQRRIARQIAAHTTRWTVLWGLHSRRYWAFPLFDAPQRAIVHDSDPNGLLTQMQRAELAARTRQA